MNLNNIEINILVKGRKAKEFQSPMDFQTYIEGRDGSEFEIELVNNHSTDVEAIISVDGLSVTDGKPAGSESAGYMVKARSRLSIPGWMVDKETVAKFFFAGSKGGSYAEQAGQDDRNKGVIGAKVFARKYTPVASFTTTGLRSRGFTTKGMVGGIAMGANQMYTNASDPFMGATLSVSSAAASGAVSSVTTGSLESVPLTSPGSSTTETDNSYYEPVEQTLGTGFGDAADFNTTTVDFQRGDLVALIELFYDDEKGLKRRGIDVHRSNARPSAFPADEPKGCTPPAGWSKNR
jgi:hypothetical protein